MKLLDIIEAVKSNEPVGTEDMIYTILALDNLLFFERQSIRTLANGGRGNQKPSFIYDPLYQEKESFRRIKNAIEKDPKEWLGWNNDPKNPDYQYDKEMAHKVLDKIISKRLKRGNRNEY
jgi:hypothetical protein